jgi:flavin-dependent dehydrogenase
MEPIKILGAGPAGLTAAITLAYAGREVIVYERAADVGTHHEGDPEAVENWLLDIDLVDELASWGLSLNFHCAPIYSGTWFGPGFRDEATVRDSRPLFYLIVRGPLPGSLDWGLLAQAREAGVEVRFNCPAEPAAVDIVSGGAAQPRAYGVGYNFKTSAANAACICYDDDLTPGTFSYLAFCEGLGAIVAVAFAPLRGVKERLPRIVEGFRSRLAFDMQEPTYFAATVGFNLPQTAQPDGKLYAGEAGGFQDFFAGFGIRMAMTTGYLAARSLLEGRHYDELWRPRYEAVMRAAVVNRWAQEVLGNYGYPLMLRYLRRHANNGRAILRRHYYPLWYTSLLWPLAKRMLNNRSRISR